MNLSQNQLINLEILRVQALECVAYANYHVHFAISEANKRRSVYDGNNIKLSAFELEKDSFDTAKRHISRLDEIKKAIQGVIQNG